MRVFSFSLFFFFKENAGRDEIRSLLKEEQRRLLANSRLVFERKEHSLFRRTRRGRGGSGLFAYPDAGYRGSFEPRSTRPQQRDASRSVSLSRIFRFLPSLCSLSMDLTARISSQTYALSKLISARLLFVPETTTIKTTTTTRVDWHASRVELLPCTPIINLRANLRFSVTINPDDRRGARANCVIEKNQREPPPSYLTYPVIPDN